MHPDQEQLQRYLHGELPDSQGTMVREHLHVCAECRALVDAAAREEAETHALLRHLDHARVHPTAQDIPHLARRSSSYRYRRAAAILLALGLAGSVYAIPGSPVRDWVDVLLDRNDPTSKQAPPGAVPRSEPDQTGVEVEPGSSLVIDFVRRQSQGDAMVALTDSALVTVRTQNGTAIFTSDADRLLIDNTGAASYQIHLPRRAPRIEIRLGGQRIFLKQGDSITATRPADTTGTFALPLR